MDAAGESTKTAAIKLKVRRGAPSSGSNKVSGFSLPFFFFFFFNYFYFFYFQFNSGFILEHQVVEEPR